MTTRPPDASEISITVYGLPAPQGSKSFKGMRTSKATGRTHAVMVESSKKVKPWRKDVTMAAKITTRGTVCLDGPIVARMVFTMPKPKSAPKTRRTYPDRMPDLSKLVRSTEDALKDAGIIADDARIVEYSRIAKVYPSEDPEAMAETGARITLRLIR